MGLLKTSQRYLSPDDESLIAARNQFFDARMAASGGAPQDGDLRWVGGVDPVNRAGTLAEIAALAGQADMLTQGAGIGAAHGVDPTLLQPSPGRAYLPEQINRYLTDPNWLPRPGQGISPEAYRAAASELRKRQLDAKRRGESPYRTQPQTGSGLDTAQRYSRKFGFSGMGSPHDYVPGSASQKAAVEIADATKRLQKGMQKAKNPQAFLERFNRNREKAGLPPITPGGGGQTPSPQQPPPGRQVAGSAVQGAAAQSALAGAAAGMGMPVANLQQAQQRNGYPTTMVDVEGHAIDVPDADEMNPEQFADVLEDRQRPYLNMEILQNGAPEVRRELMALMNGVRHLSDPSSFNDRQRDEGIEEIRRAEARLYWQHMRSGAGDIGRTIRAQQKAAAAVDKERMRQQEAERKALTSQVGKMVEGLGTNEFLPVKGETYEDSVLRAAKEAANQRRTIKGTVDDVMQGRTPAARSPTVEAAAKKPEGKTMTKVDLRRKWESVAPKEPGKYATFKDYDEDGNMVLWAINSRKFVVPAVITADGERLPAPRLGSERDTFLDKGMRYVAPDGTIRVFGAKS